MVTIEISNQGGIVAVNGFYNNFNVTQIQIVTVAPQVKRDKKREVAEYTSKTENNDFASTLNQAMDGLDTKEAFIQTYDAKSQMHPFYFTKHKEYSI